MIGQGSLAHLDDRPQCRLPQRQRMLAERTRGSGDPYAGIGPSPLAIGEGGVLYGTVANDGNTSCTTFPGGCGTVFAVHPPSSPGGSWGFKTIYSFTGGNDGANPSGGVVIAENGELFGTASQGGASGYGTIFSLTPPKTPLASWTEAPLYSFPGSPGNPGSGETVKRCFGP